MRAGRARTGPLESWRGTLIVALILIALFAAVVVVASARGPLRHVSFPGHPYPPPGLVQNPFSDRDDLLDETDVVRVRSEFQRDSQVDLVAVERGDAGLLEQARTGNALDSLVRLIESNNAQGIAEREQVSDDAVIVGRLPDPNDPEHVTWCVEERGRGTNTYFAKTTGQPVRTETVTFDHRTWLARAGDRYLIKDVEVLPTAR